MVSPNESDRDPLFECERRLEAVIHYCKSHTPWEDTSMLVIRSLAEGKTTDQMLADWDDEIG